ncbi:MAG TPA: amidohydrolase family protein [Acidimicrobiales bacterium]|nr:amidohydrolase family protein [Acidimicrobiales bacterium]
MTPRPIRVVDAHVHLWDPDNSDWYPYLSTVPHGAAGDPSRMYRKYDVRRYRSESEAWHVDKFVNVAAATGRNSIEETIALDRSAEADGGPHGIIGGLPPTGSIAESIEDLDRQMTAPRFRGVRPMGPSAPPVPEVEVLEALRDRNLVFELMARSDQLAPSAEQLEGVDGLQVVVEHTGWPRSGAPEEYAVWREGITALAELGPEVSCKLSGLAMPLQTMDASVLGPWIEHAIECFGVSRCLFASNFPVDATYGTFDDLYETFSAVTAGLDEESRDLLFASNAERIYRL